MTFSGKSAKSAPSSGGSDVGKKVASLEKAVKELQAQVNDKCSGGGGGDCDEVIAALKTQFPAKFANL